ncbi:hypothetical protein COY95_01965, partial [Candidatus Woesearchaeota archaeon CG_4_10_14_0_8_um_filter_47_5]
GGSERKLDEALGKLANGEIWEMGLGNFIGGNPTISSLAIMKTMNIIGTGGRMSAKWLRGRLEDLEKEKLLQVGPEDISLYFRYRYPDLVGLPQAVLKKEGLKHVRVRFQGESHVSERLARAAELAYRLNSIGVEVMGNYRKGKNDCFTLCNFLLRLGLEEGPEVERVWKDYGEDKNVELAWYNGRNQKAALKDLRARDCCFIQVGSPVKEETEVRGDEHWVFYHRGAVYDFVGKNGIRKMAVAKFLEETNRKGRVIASLGKPLEAKERQGSGAAI